MLIFTTGIRQLDTDLKKEKAKKSLLQILSFQLAA
jgi:hypothetical protein